MIIKKTKRNDGEKCSRNLKNDIFGLFRNIKLISLCPNKKIMESLDSYDETDYDENEDSDKEEEELEAI